MITWEIWFDCLYTLLGLMLEWWTLGVWHLFVLVVHNVILPFLLQEGDSALHDAVRLNRYKIIKMLILHGADMMAKNRVSIADLWASARKQTKYFWWWVGIFLLFMGHRPSDSPKCCLLIVSVIHLLMCRLCGYPLEDFWEKYFLCILQPFYKIIITIQIEVL